VTICHLKNVTRVAIHWIRVDRRRKPHRATQRWRTWSWDGVAQSQKLCHLGVVSGSWI